MVSTAKIEFTSPIPTSRTVPAASPSFSGIFSACSCSLPVMS